MKIEKATLDDVKAIHDLVYSNAMKGLMLYRTKEDIAYRIRDYFVCRENGKPVGCVGLKIWDKDAAEIYALAVSPKRAGQGVGKSLVKACMNDGERMGLDRIFALTFRKEMFLKLGFRKLKIKDLPKKIFTEKTVDVDKAYGIRF